MRVYGQHPHPKGAKAGMKDGKRMTPRPDDYTANYLMEHRAFLNRDVDLKTGGPDGRPLVGNLPGLPVGAKLPSRQMMRLVGAHAKPMDGIFVVLHCEGRIEGSGEGVTDADLRQGTVAKILGHPEFAACICDGGNYQVRACVGAWVG